MKHANAMEIGIAGDACLRRPGDVVPMTQSDDIGDSDIRANEIRRPSWRPTDPLNRR